MRFTLPLLALLGAAPAMSAETDRPVRLEVRHDGDMLDIAVVGVPASARDARFDLEVASKGQGGTTRTVQSGARKGGAGGTLLHSRIGTSGLAGWTVKLKVEADGESYTEERAG